ALAAGWLISTRPGHRIEGDFLEREQAFRVDDWLLAQATTNTIAEQRARACLTLGRIGDPVGRPALIEGLASHAPSVRAMAAFGLGLMEDAEYLEGREPDQQAADALLVALGDDERQVVAYAVEALGRMRWKPAAEALTQTPAPMVYTLTALARMNARELIPWIARALSSNDQDIRWAAAVTLNTMRAPCDEGIRRSFSNLTRDRNAFVRAAVTQGLGRCELDDQAVEALRRSAADPDPKVRIEAAWAAARTGDERVRELITALAGDAHPAVTEQAAGLVELAGGAARAHWEDRARRAGRVLDLRSPLPTLPLPVTKEPRETAEPFAPHELQEIARRTGRNLVMETPEGSFPLTLDYEHAPLAAERFYNMAVAAQFDGQPFSVLPNDYAQIPAKPSSPLLTPEPSPAPFLRGSLGMVRASRTTDAPEFFIALTPLPGAEGRYTNFGRLLAGDDVLDRLRSGTRVLRIRPSEE
ncbi:MAG: HEAT repeat domain-containing protein, partial [Acidobacteria bacterium]|nr:HEAT repeat domain-containing protein [Acidobacteriota bacterium]